MKKYEKLKLLREEYVNKKRDIPNFLNVLSIVTRLHHSIYIKVDIFYLFYNNK